MKGKCLASADLCYATSFRLLSAPPCVEIVATPATVTPAMCRPRSTPSRAGQLACTPLTASCGGIQPLRSRGS